MGDEWDEDEFGTFESAGATSPIALETPSLPNTASTPAWLLAAQYQSPQGKSDTSSKDVSGDQVLQDDGSNSSFTSRSTDNTADQSSGGQWQAFDSATKESLTVSESATPPFSNEGSVFEEVFKKPIAEEIDALQCGDRQATPNAAKEDAAPVAVAKSSQERDLILELQGKLDVAIAMKEQTEKTIADLQRELAESLEDMKVERERKEAGHKAEVKRIKEAQEKEITQLKEESQKTMELLTKEYSNLASQTTVQERSEYEKSLEVVVEKCLELLQQQHAVLSERLNQERTNQNKDMQETVEQCKIELKDFVKKECDDTAQLCKETKEDMKIYLKGEIDKEYERQREIDSKCKRDIMDELKKSFQLQMEESMRLERDKLSEVVKQAADDARCAVLDSVEQDKKEKKIMQDHHVMALQMLLSSSQEHLRHISEGLPNTSTSKET